jgi:fructokinase
MHAVGIGELLWDLLPDGPRLGGAPCNVLINLVRLGHRATYVTGVGRDDLGRAALRQLIAHGVETSLVAIVDDRPTGTARVNLDADGVPVFSIVRPAAYDALELLSADLAAIAGSEAGALIYGTLAQQTPAVRRSTRLVARAIKGGIRFYDVNLREGCWDADLVRELASLATVIKLNQEEANIVGPLLGAPLSDTEAFCRGLATRLGLRGVAVTAGASGASLFLDGLFVRAPAPDVDVVDTIGSGDAFSAALIDGIAAGANAETVLRRATALGALVASRAGATPSWTLGELAALVAATENEEREEPWRVADTGGDI